MAIVIIGGLVASTLLNLFVVPVAVPALRPSTERATGRSPLRREIAQGGGRGRVITKAAPFG